MVHYHRHYLYQHRSFSALPTTRYQHINSLRNSQHTHQLSTHQRYNNNNHYLISSASYRGQQAAYSLKQYRCHRHNTRLGATENEVAANNEYDNDDEEVGIGVGIDLGTTNSAVAMMIPAKDDGRYVPYNVCCEILLQNI